VSCKILKLVGGVAPINAMKWYEKVEWDSFPWNWLTVSAPNDRRVWCIGGKATMDYKNNASLLSYEEK